MGNAPLVKKFIYLVNYSCFRFFVGRSHFLLSSFEGLVVGALLYGWIPTIWGVYYISIRIGLFSLGSGTIASINVLFRDAENFVDIILEDGRMRMSCII